MNTELRTKLNFITNKLTNIENSLTDFLNETSINLVVENDPSADEDYAKLILKQLRYIEVLCSEGNRTLRGFSQFKYVSEERVNRVFNNIYLKCIEQFFSPNNNVWFEDSRASYKNKSSIDFKMNPGKLLVEQINKIEPLFHQIREQLEYLPQH